ncbi:hypothetical protein R1flu_012553 [Riccia fluitans]|uniref:MBD domain-containing protein n=1 Tax=Riccia fluitans TaxID=41844 RepID=A0ABD1ZB22_9MARC
MEMMEKVRNPLAGKVGIGRPIAPECWKWRAGLRLQDMYFTSPEGRIFRSRKSLNEYLDEEAMARANPPSPDSFQWRVTEEFLARNPVACDDAVARRPRPRRSVEGGPSDSKHRSRKSNRVAQRQKKIKVEKIIAKSKKAHARVAEIVDEAEGPVRVAKVEEKAKSHIPVVKVVKKARSQIAKKKVVGKAKGQRTLANVVENAKGPIDVAKVTQKGKGVEVGHCRKEKMELYNPQRTKAELLQKLQEFRSSLTVKPDECELTDIQSSMKTLLTAVRARRQALEAAETRLSELLSDSQRQLGESGSRK